MIAATTANAATALRQRRPALLYDAAGWNGPRSRVRRGALQSPNPILTKKQSTPLQFSQLKSRQSSRRIFHERLMQMVENYNPRNARHALEDEATRASELADKLGDLEAPPC